MNIKKVICCWRPVLIWFSSANPLQWISVIFNWRTIYWFVLIPNVTEEKSVIWFLSVLGSHGIQNVFFRCVLLPRWGQGRPAAVGPSHPPLQSGQIAGLQEPPPAEPLSPEREKKRRIRHGNFHFVYQGYFGVVDEKSLLPLINIK